MWLDELIELEVIEIIRGMLKCDQKATESSVWVEIGESNEIG